MDADKIHNSVVDVIGELTSKNLPFSAFDVTKILRKRSVQVYHSQVKKEVSQYYANGLMPPTYFKELNTLPNGRTTWVYYPDTFDPDDYDENALPDALDTTTVTANYTTDGGTTISNPNPIVSTPLNLFSSPNMTKTINVDGRGRLCIPAYMIRRIGYSVGQPIYVKMIDFKVYAGCFSDTFDDVNAGKNITFPYKIDKSGNIRISSCVLDYFGFMNSAVYELTVENGDIRIVAKNSC